MFVIAGATGRVGSAIAHTLLDAGAEVRVIVRRERDAATWEERGAQVHLASLDDRRALAEGLRGCAGFFTLLPFDLQADDLERDADLKIGAIAGAVADTQVPHVVLLSSQGADLPSGTGPIAGLHRMEQHLQATATVVTALRSGHFQEKIADLIGLAQAEGIYPVFAGDARRPLPMGATHDLGCVAADALLAPPSASEAVDVIGPSYSERDAARVLGQALGRELDVHVIPEQAWPAALADAGFRPHVAESLAELYRADEAGLLAPRGDRQVEVHTELEATVRALLAGASAVVPSA